MAVRRTITPTPRRRGAGGMCLNPHTTMNHPTRTLIFSIESYGWTRDDLCRRGPFNAGVLERKAFADGERYLRVMTPVGDRDVALLGGTINDAAALELYDLACGIVRNGASTTT